LYDHFFLGVQYSDKFTLCIAASPFASHSIHLRASIALIKACFELSLKDSAIKLEASLGNYLSSLLLSFILFWYLQQAW
jgi:hypothetical protein